MYIIQSFLDLLEPTLCYQFMVNVDLYGALLTFYKVLYNYSPTHLFIHTDGSFPAEHWQQPITTKRNVEFSVLFKETSAHGLTVRGTEPAIL